MKINRLVQIIIILLNQKKVTAKALAERLDVSVRTIYRDLEELSIAGIPIYTNKGKNGGIYLLEEYTINKAILSDNEKRELLLALNTLSSIESSEVNKLIEKLGGLFEGEPENYLEIDLSGWGGDNQIDARFEVIKQAILNKKVLTFEYINSLGESSDREVEPYKILYRGQAWYCKAYCMYKNSERIFKLTRMRKINVRDWASNASVVYKQELSNQRHNKYHNENAVRLVPIKLRFRPSQLYRLLDMYEENQIHKDDKGHYIVEVTYTMDEWVYGHILSYGDTVEVLEPRWLREEIATQARKILKNYKYDI